jgi:LysM repeat protein
MKRQRSALTLILIPAAVSLAVTLLVLWIWNRQQPEYIEVVLPTFSGTAQIEPRATLPDIAQESPAEEEAGGEPAEEDEVVPTIKPGCENPVHVVASGETLGNIAEQYDVSIEDVATLNLMLDPEFSIDFLSIDQEIVIPVCGIPTATPSVTPTGTPVPTRNIPTPNPTATDPPEGVIMVEVARVLNPGDVTSEAVEVINLGTSVARLGGWSLVSEHGDRFEFPPLNLFPQGAVTVYTGVGEDSAIDVYWGLDTSAWKVGETVLLYDADGVLQHEFEIEEE